jgi:hypothetical protein
MSDIKKVTLRVGDIVWTGQVCTMEEPDDNTFIINMKMKDSEGTDVDIQLTVEKETKEETNDDRTDYKQEKQIDSV